MCKNGKPVVLSLFASDLTRTPSFAQRRKAHERRPAWLAAACPVSNDTPKYNSGSNVGLSTRVSPDFASHDALMTDQGHGTTADEVASTLGSFLGDENHIVVQIIQRRVDLRAECEANAKVSEVSCPKGRPDQPQRPSWSPTRIDGGSRGYESSTICPACK